MRWLGWPRIAWIKNQFGARRPQTGAAPFCRAHCTIHDCDHCLARIRDSALGGILSLALFFTMRTCFLLLGRQLCHRRLWPHRSPANVADPRSGRKHHIGVLMCGLSTTFLFAVVTRLFEREVGSQANSRSPNGTYSRGRRFKHERAQQARRAEFNSRT
jgi:hypothetical protein